MLIKPIILLANGKEPPLLRPLQLAMGWVESQEALSSDKLKRQGMWNILSAAPNNSARLGFCKGQIDLVWEHCKIFATSKDYIIDQT
jgi:hypothetical protein